MTDFGIQEALKKLSVKDINKGTSTGSQWFSDGSLIESYSPVDGKRIGSVKTTTNKGLRDGDDNSNNCVQNVENHACPTAWRNCSSVWRKTS